MPNLYRRARELLNHPEKIPELLRMGLAAAYARRGALVHIFEDFLVLFRLVKAWVSGTYRDAPKQVIFWAVLAILYFLSPLDAFPDILPGGYLDDIAFISFIVNKMRKDLDRFKDWEKKREG